MKKLLWIFIPIVLLLLFAAILPSQVVHVFCALDQSCTWTGTQTFSGNASVGGNLTASSVNAIINPTFFAGADIGAQTNAAYASTQCFASGCRIRIPPNPAGGCWSFSTPIVFSAASKPAMLEGDPGGATCITFTAASGTAVTFDYTAAHFTGWGIRDIAIYGACTASGNIPNCSGVTSIGVSLGPSSGTDQQFISNVRIGKLGTGFLTGLYIHNTFDLTSINAQISGNNVGVLNDLLVEHNTFIGGCICSNNTGVSMTATGSEMSFSNMSIDDNIINGFSMTGNSTLTIETVHFENAGCQNGCSYFATSDQWINATAGKIFIHNGEVENDLGTTGTGGNTTVAQNMTFGGDTLDVSNMQEFVAPGHVVTNFWSLTNNSSNAVHLAPEDLVFGSRITNEYNSSYTGRLIYCPLLQVGSAQGPCLYHFYAPAFDSLSLTGQLTSTQTTGTAPFVIASTTPVANLTASNHPTVIDCGQAGTACAGTQRTAAFIARGAAQFASATTLTYTALPFTSASSYTCLAQDVTSAAGVVNATTYSSGSQVIFTETGGANTDIFRFSCQGW